MGALWSLINESFLPGCPAFKAADIPDMTGKVVLVTGGTAGIGKETARVLLTKNAKVWITSRDQSKGEATLKELKNVTRKDANLIIVNLANLKSIKGAAEEFNSGVMLPPIDMLTDDGYSRLMSSGISTLPNTFGNTSSNGHWFACLNYDTMKDGPERRRGDIIFASELLLRHGDQGIVSTSLNPGGIKTDLQRHMGSYFQWISPYPYYLYVRSDHTTVYRNDSRWQVSEWQATTQPRGAATEGTLWGSCSTDGPGDEKWFNPCFLRTHAG